MAKSQNSQQLWEKALSQYKAELRGREDNDSSLDINSVEELLRQANILGAAQPRNQPFLTKLEPILRHFNDFSTLAALYFGADAKTAALFWGSINVILKLAVPKGGDMLQKVLDMLDELSTSLPRFKLYEQTLPMNAALESSLSDVYTEIICFCARTINFFRSNKHEAVIIKNWSSFDSDFRHTITRLKRKSKLVDSEADNARLRLDSTRSSEILAIMQSLKEKTLDTKAAPINSCFNAPFGFNNRFYGREEALAHVQKCLDPQEDSSHIKSLALYGIGGVGKTRIALQYANIARDKFDCILWISAENTLKMEQSFLEVARQLGLVAGDGAQDSASAMVKVKLWLANSSGSKWLLIFDNADDLEVIKYAWPTGGRGSILLTSRDFNASFSLASAGYHVKPFDTAMGSHALLSLVGQDTNSDSDRKFAEEITVNLGGLPLALNQISGFIIQQKLSLESFLPIYERNSAKIHSRKSGIIDYDYTLSSVWEMAFDKISGEASTLVNLLAFLDPDGIPESILIDGFRDSGDSKLELLSQEMEYLDATNDLLRAALIEKSQDSSLSIHRLIQAAIITRLSAKERIEFIDYAIALLNSGFPNTWREDVGHQFSAWKKCEMCLPHVNFLVQQTRKYKLHPSNSEHFAELILRCCWYLYEKEHYARALDMIQIALMNFANQKSLAYASAVDLLGLLQLDTANSKGALENFRTAHEIRESLLGKDDAFIASSLNNISLAFTELDDLDQAVSYQQKAIDIRLRTNSDRIGNSYSNLASTLMKMGEADKAEEVLRKCPALKEFTDETFLNTGNPRFSGDMVLLSRIRLQQGRIDDAIRLSSKALEFRQNVLENGLKTCDSLYQVASLLHIRGNHFAAIDLLQKSVGILESLSEGKGYLARAHFQLSEIYKVIDDQPLCQSHREIADSLRLEIAPNSDSDAKSFDKLVLWMLW